jgi:hypothetical protein
MLKIGDGVLVPVLEQGRSDVIDSTTRCIFMEITNNHNENWVIKEERSVKRVSEMLYNK